MTPAHILSIGHNHQHPSAAIIIIATLIRKSQSHSAPLPDVALETECHCAGRLVGIERERRSNPMIYSQAAHPMIAEWVKVLIGPSHLRGVGRIVLTLTPNFKFLIFV